MEYGANGNGVTDSQSWMGLLIRIFALILKEFSLASIGELFGPLTPYYLCSPACLEVSCGDGSTKGLDKANHCHGWFLQLRREDALVQGDLIVSAFDDGVIQEGIGITVACCEDDTVNVLKHGPILKHSGGLCELLHIRLDGHGATQDACWELVIEHGFFPESSIWTKETGHCNSNMSPLS